MSQARIQKNKSKDEEFIDLVLAHYGVHGRHDLPWRKNTTSYRVLVSEVMLQQTQVPRVKEKFTLWMKLYPTLASLRKATLKEILILWQGLGYQRRAKALYEIAQETTPISQVWEEVLELKGVGTYTASALCAFAYNTFSHPLLETNIRTALIEVFHPRKKTVSDEVLYSDLRRLEQHEVVQESGARVWYYALMDYGAMLKANKISHNKKAKGYTKQKPYKGSSRELRAKLLFSIAHSKPLPKDIRAGDLLVTLEKEGYIRKVKKSYAIS